MNRKGSFDYIISAILILILVFGVSYFFTSTSWKAIQSFLGISTDEPMPDNAVYGGCQPAVCSVQALVCGINSAGLGRPAWLEPNSNKLCPGEFKTPSAKVDTLKTVTLPTKKEEAIKILVQETLDCWNAFERNNKQNIICSKISANSDEKITEKEFAEALRNSGSLGKDIAGTVHNYEWRIGDLTKKDFYICADSKGINDIFFTQDLSDCPALDQSLAKASCSGILFGGICLECDQGAKANSNNIGIDGLAKIISNCYYESEETRKNTFCTMVKKGALTAEVTEQELKNYIIRAADEKIRNTATIQIKTSSDAKKDLKKITPEHTYYICVKSDHGTYQIQILRYPYLDPECNKKWQEWRKTEQSPAFGCKVNGFELPQVVTSFEEWIIDNGDPEYLVYYEKFPEGEQKAWQSEAQTLIMVTLGVRTALTLIPLAKNIPGISKVLHPIQTYRLNKINKLAYQLSNSNLDDATRIIINEELTGLLDKTGINGLRALAISLKKGQKSVLSQAISEDIIERVSTQADSLKKGVRFFRVDKGIIAKTGKFVENGKYTEEGIGALYEELLENLQKAGLSDDLAKKAAKNFEVALSKASATDDIADIARASVTGFERQIDEAFEQSIRTADLTSQAKILKRVGFKRAAAAYYSDDSIKNTEELIKKTFPSIKRVQASDPATFNQIISRIDDTSSAIFSGNGDDIAKIFIQEPQKTERILQAMADDDIARALSETGIIRESSSTIKGGMQSGLGFIKKESELVRKCLIHVTPFLAGGVTYFYSEDGQAAASAALLTAIGTNTKDCLNFVKYNYLPLIAGTALMIEKADAANQKFTPLGKNMLGVAQPTLRGGKDGGIVSYDIDAAGKYYLNLAKSDSQSRFYMASPCKADLALSTGMCSCELSSKDFVYIENGIMIPIQQPQTASLNDLETKYQWDYATDEEKYLFVRDRRDFGKSWWQWAFSMESTIIPPDYVTTILDVVLQNPSYTKTAYYFIYYNNPTYFWESVGKAVVYAKRTSQEYHPTGAGGTTTFQQVTESSHYLNEEDENIYLAGKSYSSVEKKYMDFEKDYKTLVQDLHSLLDKSNSKCFKDLLNSIVDFFWSHEPGDAEKFVFTCSQKTLSTEGYMARYLVEELNGPSPEFTMTSDFWDLFGLYMVFSSRAPYTVPYAAKQYREFIDWKKKNSAFKEIKLNWDDPLVLSKLDINSVSMPLKAADIYKEQDVDALMTADVGPANGLFSSGFFDYVAKQAAFQLYIFKGDKSNIVRKCSASEKQAPTKETLLHTTIPCITANAEGIDDKYSDYDPNYCFTDDNPTLKTASTALNWASIVGGLALIPFTAGQSAYLTIYGVSAGTELAAVATDYILLKCGAWPSHRANLKGCF